MSFYNPVLTAPLKDRSINNLATSSIQLLPPEVNRKYLLIENTSAVNIGLAIQPQAASIGSSGTITIVPTGSLVFETNFCPTNGFNIISASGSGNTVSVWEA